MRHALTLKERIRGIRKALDSPKTPEQLKPGLATHLKALEAKQVYARRKRRPKGRPARPRADFLDWLVP